MVMFSFKPQFVAAIQRGDKRQTIRAPRKRNARFGDQLQLYTGPRMAPRLIGTANCIGAGPVRLDFENGGFEYSLEAEPTEAAVHVAGAAPGQLENFARRDGFADWNHMRAWWLATYDVQHFDGWLTLWGQIDLPDDTRKGDRP